jgi:threonine/homoserine/homoserine lactone efflux protein
MAFLKGLLFGIAMIAFIGPVLFTLLKASLDHGFKGGFAVALGIIFSDLVAVVICLLGAIPFFENEGNQLWISVAGGLILLFLGLKYIIKPKLFNQESVTLGTKDFIGLFGSGFLVNFVNPFVFIIWIGIIVYGQKRFGMDSGLFTFIAGVLAGIFGTDTLKAFFAEKFQPYTNPVVLKKVYFVIGVGMIGFGIRAFYHALTLS